MQIEQLGFLSGNGTLVVEGDLIAVDYRIELFCNSGTLLGHGLVQGELSRPHWKNPCILELLDGLSVTVKIDFFEGDTRTACVSLTSAIVPTLI